MPDSAAGHNTAVMNGNRCQMTCVKYVGVVYEILKMLQSQWRSKSGSVERFKFVESVRP